MIKLNEDFIDRIDNNEIVSSDSNAEGRGSFRNYPIWLEFGTGENDETEPLEDTLKKRTEHALEATPEIIRFSDVEVEFPRSTYELSGVHRDTNIPDEFVILRDFDDPVTVGFESNFKNSRQVLAFLLRLRKIFRVLDVRLAFLNAGGRGKTEKYFWFFDNVLEFLNSNNPTTSVSNAIAFWQLVGVFQVLLPQKNPVVEAQNLMDGIDFQMNFRIRTLQEFLNKYFRGTYSRRLNFISENRDGIDSYLGRHLMICDLIQKVSSKEMREMQNHIFVAVQNIVEPEIHIDFRSIYGIEREETYDGLVEIEVSSMAAYQGVDNSGSPTVFMQMSGGYFTNTTTGEIKNICLMLTSPDAAKMEKFLAFLFEQKQLKFHLR